MTDVTFSPGSLVRARGREWIVLNGSTPEVLHVRPIMGSEHDEAFIHVGLEAEPVDGAQFPRPGADQIASHDAALLLRDALLLSLRRGAGPFRSFGHIAVEPRAYQLVPLMMALRLETVRLCIADDVGVGKTIEGALIARELLDRGEIDRTTVLCPPHLVDQWVGELRDRFHLRAAAVTAANAARLERELPPGRSVFEAHPHTVVSLDYIKSEKRRADFLRACPEFVIVDEAHTCAATGPGRHQRYDLLRGLAADRSRHLVLLTATPHSGDDEAFHRLLGLLNPDFAALGIATEDERKRLRARLARNFVQRRRPDIAEWKEGELFARREKKELTYTLTGEWEAFFDAVLDYCAGVVQEDDGPIDVVPTTLTTRQRLNFWGTLALLRCAASSPAAAVFALRSRAGIEDDAAQREELLDRLFEGSSDDLPDDDLGPLLACDDPALAPLLQRAAKLAGQVGDPKLKVLTEQISRLLEDGFQPVVFCRYIATAHYVGRYLREKFKKVEVAVVTGEMVADERKGRVFDLEAADKRILVATDCLSEGINLQTLFDAVVHYDLSWNPTRHEQREGRVDRFNQKSKIVRTTLMYGSNNPVDGAVLEVILRKAETIREQLGVAVPLPDEGRSLTQALLKAVLLRSKPEERKAERQRAPLLFPELEVSRRLNARWEQAIVRARDTGTVFAQLRLKPDEVLPEWQKSLAALGNQSDVERFTERALARLGSGMEPKKPGFLVPLAALDGTIRERLRAEGFRDSVRIDFSTPPGRRCLGIHRTHPFVSVLAETLLEQTLGGTTRPGERAVLGRVGCWMSDAVTTRTVVALVRLRDQLVRHRGRRDAVILVEEAGAVSWAGAGAGLSAEGDAALALLSHPPAGELAPAALARHIDRALLELDQHSVGGIADYARRRATALLADHDRVREASQAAGRTEVTPSLPADIVALFVLLPRVS